MKLVDTHAHLYYDRFDTDREQMLRRAFEVCEAIICIGAGIESSKKSIEQAKSHPQIFATVGVHPHEIQDSTKDLKALTSINKVVAIGECGLDYKQDPVHPHSKVDKKAQQISMQEQIKLANELDLPIIIHARDCYEDLIPILKNLTPKSGLIHSFTGHLKDAEEIFEMGLNLSFSGMLTYPANEHLRQVASMAPLDGIVVETDAPYLPPQSVRGQRNEPAFVKITAMKLAELRGQNLEDITTATTTNAKRIFRLP